jgi:hypothetical protein
MATLGSFGTSHAKAEDAEPDTFEWFGADIRIRPEFGTLVWQDWNEEFGYIDADHPAAISSGKELFRRMVDERDFDQFWRLAIEHRQGNGDLSVLLQGVLGAVAGRPTQRPVESSTGPEASEAESKVAFLRQVSVGRPDIEGGLVEMALARSSATA